MKIDWHYGKQLATTFIGALERQDDYLLSSVGEPLGRFRLDFPGSDSASLANISKIVQEIFTDIFAGANRLVVFDYVVDPLGLPRFLAKKQVVSQAALAFSEEVADCLGAQGSLFWQVRKYAGVADYHKLLRAKVYQDFGGYNVARFFNPVVYLEPEREILFYFYDDRGCELHFRKQEDHDFFAEKYQFYKDRYQKMQTEKDSH